ncbi:NADH-quinone oxidoreductase subunit H domain protein [Actinomyces johnsonii F0542]|uniref:NADH-quinone oxidoreductase subunit H n=1 Tax=Actinomyces johnsonii F0542 TaxID=1321818 RepID=U1S5D8_9ACTO|nr:NADH-quinone oxidoreductase subunit NuoH [Actinomyces johnsonii]ERH25852.1 NADH-quinone oxidoreductase subunit H domain protein [Actinomyces johnsonii F0542]
MNPIYAAQAAAADDAVSNGGVVADFSAETWWLTLIKAVFIVAFLIVSVIMALWVERRGLARMQTRLGPNVNGPLGLLQAVADAGKLIMKEDFWLKGAEKVIYLLAPLIAAFSAFMVYAVIPFGPQVSIFGHSTPLQLTDFPVAVLYILAITAFGVYGIILGGWSTHSTYPLFGAVRSAAQVISYELSMSLSILTVFLASGTMSTSGIVGAQQRIWWAVAMLPSFIIYVISMVGEVNRLPFDLPEAEGELVAGHMVEYSSMKFAWYFLAEYINMFNVSAVCVTLFLGGWRSTILSLFWEGANSGWWPMLWFIGKVWAVMFFMIWTRGTLVRIRYDHFMKLGWKVLIPVSLVWLVLVAVVRAFRTFSGASVQALLLPLAGAFCLIMLGLFLIPDKGDEEEFYDEYDEDDTEDDVEIMNDDGHVSFLEGFPVPSLPGQSLPPSPRARRAALAVDLEDSEGGASTAVGLLNDVELEDDETTGFVASADTADTADSADSADTAGADEVSVPLRSGADAATALPTFTLDLKADTASDKAADKATEAPQEGKDD